MKSSGANGHLNSRLVDCVRGVEKIASEQAMTQFPCLELVARHCFHPASFRIPRAILASTWHARVELVQRRVRVLPQAPSSRTVRTLSTELQKDEAGSTWLVAAGCRRSSSTPVRIPCSTASDRRNHLKIFEITGDLGRLGSKGDESLITSRGALRTALAPMTRAVGLRPFTLKES